MGSRVESLAFAEASVSSSNKIKQLDGMISSCALFYLYHSEIFHGALGFFFLLSAKKEKRETDAKEGEREVPLLPYLL